MLSENSILRRLPPGVNPKQLVFVDGIRHAAEIAALAYSRLESTLTWIVSNTHDSPPQSQAYTTAFLDAWAVVDAVDRFRLLWKMFPGITFAEPQDPSARSFDEIAQPVRNLRNVADHLAQHAEYVAASGNPVLGLLSWITFPSEESDDGFSCVLAPGTRSAIKLALVNPAGGGYFSVPRRTGMIHLAAGEHRANLSEVLPEMRSRVEELEHGLAEQIRLLGLEGKQAGGDHFLALTFKAGAADTSIETQPGADWELAVGGESPYKIAPL
ncbi:MAG: hypothetical protein ACREUD_00410 [Gammaproteobacteria bacterium]